MQGTNLHVHVYAHSFNNFSDRDLKQQVERQQTQLDAQAQLLIAQVGRIVDLELKQKISKKADATVVDSHGNSNNIFNTTESQHVNAVDKRQGYEGPVAFTAIKVQNQANIGLNQKILFDRVDLNEGNGFHVNQGVFIAPASGIYIFSFTIQSKPSNSFLHADLMLNGRPIVTVHGAPGTTYDQGSHTVFLNLRAGAEVWVQIDDFGNEYVHGDMFSSFSGCLLHPL